MVNKIKFKNDSDKYLEVLIEPAAEFIDLPSGETILIELTKITNEYDDELYVVLKNGMLVIYETRQCDMKIFIADELKYFTTPNSPRI